MKASKLSLHRLSAGLATLACLILILSSAAVAQDKLTLKKDQIDLVKWRSIGPANMGGRITALAVFEKDPSIWWAASASGGLLKTVNNGNTFEHQFDDQATVSIGDVQVAQSDSNIVWVGTGESNPRNSVSWGDGVYKSTDGGKTWKNMGLKKIFQTGRIAIHPTNPDIVYVGALGRLWGPSEDRGLFKTTDGGKTWDKILYVDDRTGVIDVQMNLKNPEQLMVATYERERDGFDGNDPGKKYGAGSAIYTTTDGGENFTKCTEGLPTCKLGRVGLSIYRKDPRYVYAIVESEKIAKEPEDAAFAGIRGEDVEAGARVSTVTDDSPASKAGLKVGDIVVMVGGELVHSYDGLLSQVRKSSAGKKETWLVSRDKKTVKLTLEYTKKPASSSRRSRSPFTGTLGGQSANRQDEQGKDGHEYGGIYMSKDFGKSWTRINTLNPRPMYYSQIRVDPSNKNHIFVCGTSLYRSKDGGKTFTGDGGSDGIHVDHHAMYVDPNDGRHIILGNDGGIHVSYDRMDHWDHLNHVAIGQFYHVGVGPNKDYHVYGGLQDNGSWGAPVRAGDGRLVNSDWYNVGGGDGFVTLVDPEDKDQVYFESQNGAMGTINFRTGQRGFLRPRPPRGVRYRFNWKTPFILSPHSSKVHYSAGNHVFRSSYKGNGMKSISPDITNTSRGAGSAITESAVEEGVLYVGTTDGAVWMTKNGGIDWTPLFSKKEEKKADEKDTDKAKDDKAKSSDDKSDSSDSKSAPADKNDKISGTWTAEMTGGVGGQGRGGQNRAAEGRGQGRRQGRRGFTMNLKLGEKGAVTGDIESRGGSVDISEGKFDAKTNKLTFVVESERGTREYSAELQDDALSGKMKISMGERTFEIEFKAKKGGGDTIEDSANFESSLLEPLTLLNTILVANPMDDPISGVWKGRVIADELPDGGIEITIVLKMDEQGILTGTFSAPDAPGDGEVDILEGKFKAESKKLYFYGENGEITMDAEGVLEGKKLSGDIQINDQITLEFEVELVKKAEAKAKAEPKADAKAEAKADTKGEAKAKPAQDKPAKAKSDEQESDQASPSDKATAEDLVSGDWEGEFISEQMPAGSTGVSLTLKQDAKGNVTGSYETRRGGSDFTEGKFDAKKNTITLVSENLEFTGKIKDGTMTGEVDFGGGRFQMDFEVKRTSAAQPVQEEVSEKADEVTEGTLESLVPGPRWVSSLEASRFAKGRCYITLDGHRSNDDEPYVFMTNDYGKTWKSIRANLPTSAGTTRVLREDLENENLLYLGCEFSAWVSLDRGQSWTRMAGGFPTVAVHEFAQHPTRGEIVAGTHGRSLWVADVSALRQMTSENLKAKATLMKPNEVIRWRNGKRRGASGTRRFVGESAPSGANVVFALGQNARSVSLEISSVTGDVLKKFESVPTSRGVHVMNWDLRRSSGRNQRGGRRFGGPSVGVGTYLITLVVDGESRRQTLTIVNDPSTPTDAVAEDEELQWLLELSEGETDGEALDR